MGRDDLLTTKAAAAIIGISLRGVQALVAKGTLPAEKVGRDHLIRRADAERVKADRPTRGRPVATDANGRRRKPESPARPPEAKAPARKRK